MKSKFKVKALVLVITCSMILGTFVTSFAVENQDIDIQQGTAVMEEEQSPNDSQVTAEEPILDSDTGNYNEDTTTKVEDLTTKVEDLTSKEVKNTARSLKSKAVLSSYVENGFTFSLDDTNYTATITDYDGVIKDVIIPETVQYSGQTYTVNAIGDNAFDGLGLTSVKFTDNIVTIGNSAFSGNVIKVLHLPDSVISIGIGSFANNALESVGISNNITEIPNGAFSYNTSLKTIDIPNGVTRIGDSAFIQCQINDLVIPDSVTYIGDYTFYANRLNTLKLSNNLQHIGSSAFATQSMYFNFQNSITRVVIPDSVTYIGYQAFFYNKIDNIVMSGNIEYVGGQAFMQGYPRSANELTLFINDFDDMDNVTTVLKSNSALNGTHSTVVFYAFNSIEGGYVDGTQNSYTLSAGETQELSVGDFVYPLLRKSMGSTWIDPAGISMPVVDPTIEWYKADVTYQDTLVGNGPNFIASQPGTYYAKINGVKQLGNIQILAKQVPYTLDFDLNGGLGSAPKAQTLLEGALGSAPKEPAREGYSFRGWNTLADGSGTSWDFTTTKMPSKDVTLYAQWKKNINPITDYTLRFDLNGGQGVAPENQILSQGQKATKPVNPTRKGYVFKEWNTAEDGNGQRWDFGTNTMPANDVTLYAQWTKQSLLETGDSSNAIILGSLLILSVATLIVISRRRYSKV